jgi:hypothetical protein
VKRRSRAYVIALRTTHADEVLAAADMIVDGIATLFPDRPSDGGSEEARIRRVSKANARLSAT